MGILPTRPCSRIGRTVILPFQSAVMLARATLRRMWGWLPSLPGRLMLLGVSAEDDEQQRLRTATSTLIAVVVVLLSPLWIGTYLALGHPLAASLPGAYMLISTGSLLCRTTSSWLLVTTDGRKRLSVSCSASHCATVTRPRRAGRARFGR